MDNVQELHADFAEPTRPEGLASIQAGGFLVELSLDWIVRRASENVHHLLGESHATLIDEPLGRFVQAQALHDLRNLFSRLSGTTGVARAYGVRLTEERERFDVAFQLSGGRAILEAVPAAEQGFGEAFGTVAGLIAGLGDSAGQDLFDGGARRMRALTGFDRVTLRCGDRAAVSSRGAFAEAAQPTAGLPAIVIDTEESSIALFPRGRGSLDAALMNAPGSDLATALRDQGIRSSLCVPVAGNGETIGEFRCDSRTPRRPSFEAHAAAELFAQSFAMRLEIDRLKTGR